MSLIGKKAPLFKAQAVINGGTIIPDFSLDQYIGKKYVIFFFYPKEFSFVCPTELHAFQAKSEEFEKRNVAVVACSTDTEQSHWGWLQVPKSQGGIQGVKY
ncbi:MAG: redoxin domain-containing protein, partial [Bacteroidetes bacterium]|nr:redoxin domain-containing protein [Bacteroidota bacterium]